VRRLEVACVSEALREVLAGGARLVVCVGAA
jgi:hypothetical protein